MRTLAKLGLLEELVKQADISLEEHMKGLASSEAKALELAKLRGLTVPMKDVPISMEGGIPIYESRPDLENFRMSGKQTGPKPLAEAEVIKSHNPYANSSLMRAKHRWLNPVKRFMHTTPGKALGIGALGATGLGLYTYLNNRKTPQPEQYQLSPQEQQMMQQQMYGAQPKMGAANNYSNVMIPRPPAVPQISSPGPAVANSPQIKRDPLSIGAFSAPRKEPGKDAMKETTAALKSADIDPAITTLLAGGIGGGAGYMAGKHLISPLLEDQEKSILKELAEKEQTLGRWRTARRFTPIGVAALGAVALATIAAAKARNDERSKIHVQNLLGGHLQSYDPTNAGFGAADQVPMGAPYDQVYG